MKKSQIIIVLALITAILAGCKNSKPNQVISPNANNIDSLNAGDTTIYGTMLDGGMNSILLLTDAGDTLEIIQNPDDTTEVVKGGKLSGDRFTRSMAI